MMVLLSFFKTIFIIVKGIGALPFYKGLKYIVVNRVKLDRFTKDQPFICTALVPSSFVQLVTRTLSWLIHPSLFDGRTKNAQEVAPIRGGM